MLILEERDARGECDVHDVTRHFEFGSIQAGLGSTISAGQIE